MPASQQRLKQNIFVRFQTFFSVCIFPWLRPFQDFPPPSQSNSPTNKERRKKGEGKTFFKTSHVWESAVRTFVQQNYGLCSDPRSRQAPNPMSSHKSARVEMESSLARARKPDGSTRFFRSFFIWKVGLARARPELGPTFFSPTRPEPTVEGFTPFLCERKEQKSVWRTSSTLSSLISGKHSLFFLLAGNGFPNVWTSNPAFSH